MEQEIDKSARTWAMACHLSALAQLVIPGPFFLNVLAPLVVWLAKRNDSPFIEDQGKESVNFQLSVTFYALILGLLTLIFGFLLPAFHIMSGLYVGGHERFLLSYVVIIPLFAALVIFDLVEVIIASIRSSNGEAHRYPLRIRFIK